MSCCYSTVLSWMQQSKSNNRGTLLSFFLVQGISCAHHSQITSPYSRDASVHVMSHLDGLAWLTWQTAEPFLLEPCWFANLTLCLLWFDTANAETCLTTETASRHVFALSNESWIPLILLREKKRWFASTMMCSFQWRTRVSCCYLHEIHRRCPISCV
jgi:hypothetical protein